VCAQFSATHTVAELLDTVPLSVLISRAEPLERGTTSHVLLPTSSRTRLKSSSLALKIHSESPIESSDAKYFDDEL
jgi:hypothetical protein